MGLKQIVRALFEVALIGSNSYYQLIGSYLDSFKFSKIMDALSIQILYIKPIQNQLIKGTPHEVP